MTVDRQDLDFPGKQPDETVRAATHRHWIFFLPDTLIFAILTLLPIAILIALSAADLAPFDYPARNYTVIFTSLWYLSIITGYYIRWLDYYLDLAVITNQRVVDIDQHGLFRRNVAELEYEEVQDVTVTKNGILPTLLNFGHVEIQTAGERRNFLFDTIPHPEHRADLIRQCRNELEQHDDKAAEAMEQAAEKMSAAAEKIQETVSDESTNSEDSAPPRDSNTSSSTADAAQVEPTEPQTSSESTADDQAIPKEQE